MSEARYAAMDPAGALEIAPAERPVTGVRFRILGPLEAAGDAGSIPLGGPRQRAVLAALIVHAGALVMADALIDAVWGDDAPDSARGIIQTYVSHLRSALGPGWILGEHGGYRLALERGLLDADVFEVALRRSRQSLLVDPGGSLQAADESLGLWRGPALAGSAHLPGLAATATRLDDLRLIAQEMRVRALLAIGDPGNAASDARALVDAHPLREDRWTSLMLALYRSGRQADALDAYLEARRILRQDLGIDPSPELAAMQRGILRQDPSLRDPAGPVRGYRLVEVLGADPEGRLYRARREPSSEDLVVRVLHPQIADSDSFVQRFEPATRALAGVAHPALAPLLDRWRDESGTYLVTRHFAGGSLRSRLLAVRPPDEAQACRIVGRIAGVLAALHHQGVTHGRLDDARVVFDEADEAWLTDAWVGQGPRPDPSNDARTLLALAARLLPGHAGIRRLEADAVGGLPCDASAIGRAVADAYPEDGPGATGGDQAQNPYKGLRPFGEADHGDFFGRNRLVEDLLGRLAGDDVGSRFLALVGPSGAGKSSILRAGLLAGIRRGAIEAGDRIVVAEVVPGTHPVDALDTAIAQVATRPSPSLRHVIDGVPTIGSILDAALAPGIQFVLVIDQLDDVFGPGPDPDEREAFLALLCDAVTQPASRVRILTTLRADRLDRALASARLGPLLASCVVLVPPLSPVELEEAIVAPAMARGVAPAPGLVARLVADAGLRPGSLPLVQYALTELWDRRDGEWLTEAAYQVLGGLSGAVSRRAERLYLKAEPSERASIRRVFLRLAAWDHGAADARRGVTRQDLHVVVADPGLDTLLERFGRHRLLTFDRLPTTREPTVELAHASLIDAWDRLRGWIDDVSEELRTEGRVARNAEEWDASGRDPSHLLVGLRLVDATSWQEASTMGVSELEVALIEASVSARDQAATEEAARVERSSRIEKRARNRLRALVGVLAAATLVSAGLAVAAGLERERAGRFAAQARVRELASAAAAATETDPERGVLLALEALDESRSTGDPVPPEVEQALHDAVGRSRSVLTIVGRGGPLVWVAPDLVVTVSATDTGQVELRDGRTGQLFGTLDAGGPIRDLAAGGDAILAAGTEEGRVTIWDLHSSAVQRTLLGSGPVTGISVSASGHVAASWPEVGIVRVVGPTGDEEQLDVALYAADTALSPDGRTLAVAGDLLQVLDVATAAPRFPAVRSVARESGVAYGIGSVAWSPDGTRIATGSMTTTPEIWDARTGVLLASLEGQSGSVSDVAWAPDSQRLASASGDGTVRVWTVAEGRVASSLELSASPVRDGVEYVAFSRDGTRLGATGAAGAHVWDLRPAATAEVGATTTVGFFGGLTFLPDGKRLVTAGPSGRLGIWDVVASEPNLSFGPPVREHWLALDAAGTTLAVGGGEGVRLFDLATGAPLGDIDRLAAAIAWSPDGSVLAVGGELLDRAGAPLGVLEEPGYVVREPRYSPDGRWIATSGDTARGERVVIWDAQSLQPEMAIDTPSMDAVFDPSGELLATDGGSTGSPAIWAAATGERLAVLGSAGVVLDVAFDPTGGRVATAGVDGTVRIHDTRTGHELLVLRGHRSAVRAVAFSPDGFLLASQGPGEVYVWAMALDELEAIARRRVTRGLSDDECRAYLRRPRCTSPDGS